MRVSPRTKRESNPDKHTFFNTNTKSICLLKEHFQNVGPQYKSSQFIADWVAMLANSKRSDVDMGIVRDI